MPQKFLWPPIERIIHILGLAMALDILRNRWEECVLSFYGLSLEALFAIMNSIACILHDIFPKQLRSKRRGSDGYTGLVKVWRVGGVPLSPRGLRATPHEGSFCVTERN